ncbi:Lrp/AsnC family transcriptional regulator [sulfur-oxidizing endosymbiont of Gigantopelta aegis]|uniref:Lrp/AsnC family transcriptional regulator n=1 Tax=sulfur-oxidizing endosymbiont of Gigantopelta aegis TaxID=2794934 RepID=UPI001FEAE526|nr:Lrp/AsnC family transcriptional regulator [sulfur-oxidizing endosymbiont of Gigantopelta aegis]
MLTLLEKQLLNDYQQGIPLVSEPYAVIATEMQAKGFSVTTDEIITRFSALKARGMISRIGPVFRPKRVGGSTLAAMAVPEARMDEVANIVSSFTEVNHNYEREHDFNLWFVVTASSQQEVEQTLDKIAQQTGLSVMNLPMESDYHIDLGFPLWC